MTPNYIRAQLPVDEERTIQTNSTRCLYVTIIEHASKGVYVGHHPDLLFIPYQDITGFGTRTSAKNADG